MKYDAIIVGGGVAGLWLGNALNGAGYDVIVIEKDSLGAGQTLASQGMIHGGQKYAIEGRVTDHAASISKMPERWDACLAGRGEIDLSAARVLSKTQVMWPAGSVLSQAAVFAAARLVNAATRRIEEDEYPPPLEGSGTVYELPEKVLDTRSLLLTLAASLKGRVLKGEATEVLPDGQVAVSGHVLQAQAVIFSGGAGNEKVFELLNVKERHTQRRPLRQIMVRGMKYPLFGHGIVGKPKPRVTVTSHPHEDGYVWYLGGDVAEKSAKMEEEALDFARKEMQEIFPGIGWRDKEWASFAVDRAEPLDERGHLPPGPVLHQRGKILLCWPVKMTFTPLLADRVLDWMKERDIRPAFKGDPPLFPSVTAGAYPWENAAWRRMP